MMATMNNSCQNGRSLPVGWEWNTIADVVDSGGVFIDGDWVESKDQDPNGEIRLIQLADVGDGYYRNRSNRFLTHKKALELGCTFLEKGDLLIARMPDPLGRACIFPGDTKQSVTVVDVCIVRTKEADHRWLMYAINSPQFRTDVESLQSGSTRKRISRKNLAKLKLPIPPLPEQERIVSRIEELLSDLEAGVAALERVRVGLKRYKASVLKAACEGRLLESRELESSDELPEGWRWSTVGEITFKMQYGTSEKANLDESGIPVLRMGNIQDGEIDFTNLKYLPEYTRGIDSLILQPGDLLFNRTNSAELVGKTAVYGENQLRATFASYLIRVKFNSDVLPEFVSYYINSLHGRKYITSVVSQQVGQANVNGTKLSNMPIPLPPLDEQRRIVAEVERRLSVVREVESAVEVGLVRAGRLRQSVLRSAFEGRL